MLVVRLLIDFLYKSLLWSCNLVVRFVTQFKEYFEVWNINWIKIFVGLITFFVNVLIYLLILSKLLVCLLTHCISIFFLFIFWSFFNKNCLLVNIFEIVSILRYICQPSEISMHYGILCSLVLLQLSEVFLCSSFLVFLFEQVLV